MPLLHNVYQEENVGTTMSYHKTFPRRPTNLIHLPPLNLPKNALSEKPKILERGSFTQAAPVKEQKEHRRVSDAIANNYSPRASHLTTSLIYETTKYGFTLEEMHVFCPRAQFEKTAIVTTDQKYPLSNIVRTPSELSHEGKYLTKSTHVSEFHSIPSTIQSTPPGKVESSVNSSHSVQKREYSEFEKRILDVQFYSKNYLSEGLPRSGTPIGTDLTRYYNLMAKAIDSDFITPLTREFLEHTQHFSSNDTLLTAFPKLTNQLLKEIDEDYIEAIKKAILDYILLDPSEQVRLGVYIQPQVMSCMKHERFPWHNSVTEARNFLKYNLFITHPVNTAILYTFQHKYSTYRLLSIDTLKQFLPMTIEQLVIYVKETVRRNAKNLQETWLSECASIIDSRREDVEGRFLKDRTDSRLDYMDKFFSSVASLMSNLLRTCVQDSLSELLTLIECYMDGNDYSGEYNIMTGLGLPTKMHVLKISLNTDVPNVSTIFEPSFDVIQHHLSDIVDVIVTSTSHFPCIEHCLFHSVENLPTNYIRSVGQNEQLVLNTKQKIQNVVNKNSCGPTRYLSTYTPFYYLIDTKTSDWTNQFINEDHSLQEYSDILDNILRLRKQVFLLPTIMPMNMFLLEADQINQLLINQADYLVTTLCNKVISNSQLFYRSICKQYDQIVETITRHVTTTSELVALQKYIDGLSCGELLALKEKQEVAAANVMFMMTYVVMKREDFLLINNTFSWSNRITPIISKIESQLQKQHDLAVEKLNGWRKRILDNVSGLSKKLKEFATKDRMSEAQQILSEIRIIENQLEVLKKEKQKINEEEMMLGLEEISEFEQVQFLATAVEPYERLWSNAVKLQTQYECWMNGPLLNVNSEEVDQEIQTLWRIAYKLTQVFNHPDKKGPFKAARAMKNRLEKFKINIPLVKALCNPGIKNRHWKMMSEKVGFDITPQEDTPLSEILKLDLERYLDELSAISSQANKEFALEKALSKMKDDWENMAFNFTPYKDTELFILSAFDDIQALLDDHIVKTTTMKGSAFVGPFEKEIKEWGYSLNRMKGILESWLKVQSAWLYLEPIFGSADIREQIPVQGKMFEEVDQNWKQIMSTAKQSHKALTVASQDQMLEKLQYSVTLLEDIQCGLNDYLEKKRLFFPRFFFLSNDELLEILSETKDPLRVQPHLKKCFESIAQLVFTPEKVIVAMESSEKERVNFCTNIVPSEAHGLVEKWLQQVEHAMKLSLKQEMAKAVESYIQNHRNKWVLMWPGQIVLAASQVHWTAEITKAIEKGSIQQYVEKRQHHIEEIVEIVRGNISKMARITLGALIVIDVHARDIESQLISSQVSNVQDFNWISHLRYYFEDQSVIVRMVTTSVAYAYEYLGNSSRLVITPLTDRCYRTLMSAIRLNLGGAPEGPAGTGKTETSKDLAKAVAKQCVVFNCSDSLDYKAMGKFFKGLAQSGAWACFDEFNRIELEVLSVIAQQLQTIQRAIIEQRNMFVFEGTYISLDPTCTIFITMNPGYAGRAELPDNLKVLFRTVAMMVPDYAMISEILLYSMGFADARNLSTKIVATYRLCSEQLSTQQHYDYGMRAVRSVLTAVGNLKLMYPDQSEALLVLKSIKDVNLPKFLSQDITLFEGIISDLFPGLELPQSEYSHLEMAIKKTLDIRNLQPVPWYIEKIIQIYNMILVRHGLMIVGEPIAGKTCAYKVLADALGDLSQQNLMDENQVDYRIINPKAITMGQLYGRCDPITNEWTDGVLANSFREHASSTSKNRKWMVFDGPVDAIWIENMNTVLDDNKKLCLMSGEIIQMSSKQNMIFEVCHLEQASPATVSRCGMIYMDALQLGWNTLVKSWMQKTLEDFTKGEKNTIEYLFNWLLPSSLDYVTKHCTQIVPCQYMHLVLNMLKLYECLLEEIRRIGGPQDEMVNVDDIAGFSVIQEKLAEEKSNMIITHFLFALVWSLSATLTSDSSLKFQEFFHKLCETESINARPKEMKFSRSLLIPKKGSIYDYIYMKKQYGSWRTWESLVDPTIITEKTKMNKILVNTKETERQNFFLRLFFHQGKPLLFVGPTGTGKSSVINSFLLKLNKDSYITCNINFSAQTSANQTQDIIVSKLERRCKGVYGPSGEKILCVFVDDLNMPALENGAQPPIELLRQWLDHGFWYDRKDTTMFELVNVKILSAMAPTSGGRNPITTRFLRHFNIIHIDAFSEDILKEIFSPMTEWHFRQFPVSLRRFSRIIIHATLDIYKKVVTKFLPTPSKSHYVFNLRDFARVIQGILLFSPQSVSEDPECIHKIIRLWTHETYRLFSDRLVDQADQEAFFKILKLSIEAQFKEKFNSVFGHLAPKGKQVTPKDMRCLIFGDFMEPKEGSVRLYDEISDQDELRQVIEKYLADYNLMSKTPMDLVMFHLAVEHITRINRVLKQPNGHCLLIGIGGTGRQSATRMAAFIAEFELIQIEMGKDYSTAEWREDLMKIIRKSGEDSTPLVFFLGDYQIKNPSFLEDINMLLNTGDIPNLYDNEQRLEIIEKMQQLTLQENITIEFTSLNMFNKFIERVRQNLHIVLAFSPIGEAFRNRLRMYPSLINCCTIDWFEQWPDDALQLVANKLLDDVEMHEDLRQQSVEMCKHFHISVRALTTKYYEALNHQNYVTPTSYLELIRTFKTLLSQKRMEILTLKNRYLVGLEKLEFSKFQINIMQKELFALQPQLLETSKETVELIKTIEKERHEVEAVKQLVEQDEAVSNKAAMEAQSIKNECEEKLKLAMPAFNTAVAALHTLKQNDITIVKAMTNPPQGVKLVMAAVCTMKGIKPDKKTDQNGKIVEDYWTASKKMLSDMKFLDSLRDYDKDNIPPAIINKIREKYISNKEFDPSIIKNVSSACEGLCKWVKAIDAYDSVIKFVAPKKESLAVAETFLKEQMGELGKKQKELKDVKAKLDSLKQNLHIKQQEKKNLEFNIELTKVKLERAEKLINGLGGEHDRWIQAVDSLTNTYDNIIGDVLLSASVVAYLGPFISSYRQECLQEWYKCCKKKGIPLSAQFSLSKTLGNPLKIREWQIAGLPVDSYSVENGIIVDNCGRWPLIIDPQGQANKWIKNMECHNKLQVTKHTDANYGRIIENCLQFGCPCLLENVGEELDPLLEPILLKQTFKQRGVDYVRFRDRVVEYSKDFRLYLTTCLRNPHYLPEVSLKVTLINFVITPNGLEDQLLGIVAAREKPDLEEKKNQLIIESAQNKRQLKEIEDKILDVLSNSQGNILEDETAIQVLSSSKTLSEDIEEKQLAASLTELDIDEVRNGYKPVARHGSILFFTISDLANIDPMYQYSLTWFIHLYHQAITNSEPSQILSERINYLNDYFTRSVHNNVCRSLFEKDKLLFTFLLCIGLTKAQGLIDDLEWRFLLTGGLALENPYSNPASDWLPEKNWSEIVRCSQLSSLQTFREHFTNRLQEWKAVYDSPQPHQMKYPSPYGEELTQLQELLVLRCLRPDKMIPAIQNFIQQRMGQAYIEPTTFDLSVSYEESSPQTPLIFILSPGVDPMAALFRFAEDKGRSKGLQAISLGQGQGPIAEQRILEATEQGTWVVLQNCHLAVSWFGHLENICETVLQNPAHTKESFRLWLTTYPSSQFPVSVLQNSIKIINEPPKGLRAKLLQSYSSSPVAEQQFFESCNKPRVFKKLLFGLCFFHALVQERRKFGALGWNIPYQFNESDLNVSIQQLQMLINDYEDPPLEALVYLTGECNYGGRVTDNSDRRLIMSLLKKFYCHDIIVNDDYKFSESGLYYAPPCGSLDCYLEYIRGLPYIPHPEVFGLHENADISKDQQETQQLFEGVLMTLPKQTLGAGKSSQDIIEDLASDILSKMPAAFEVEEIQKKYAVSYHESMNTVLVQELLRFNRLLKVIIWSLEEIQKAIYGLVVMSAKLERIVNSMIVGKVPAVWAEKSYPSLKPLGSYVSDLLARIQFFNHWISEGQPTVFWISGFYFTQSFLMGVMQNYARSHKIPIDHLTLSFRIMKQEHEMPSKPITGAYINGLFLEGACWCRQAGILSEALPKVLYDLMPIIWIKPVKKEEFQAEENYQCPVYKTSARRGNLSTTGHSTNYVLTIQLPSNRDEDYWINQGVALLCQLDN
ncbi:dynein axonemal heavy chain 3 [Octopus bimaculoides]|nr:dynein axonemal heavy chain 3 [Octopus bimaculoides]